MYFTAGAAALYVASSYWYNFRSIPTLARGRGEIIAALQRATDKGIPPLETIMKFGEINAQFLLDEVINLDFSAEKFPGTIPYRYIPYHQSIKNIIWICIC